MSNTLDLCFGGDVDHEITELFDSMSLALRPKFNELVTEISRPYIGEIDWRLQGPASRNTFSSPLFHYFCSFHLVQYLVDENEDFPYQVVQLDSEAFSNVISKLLKDSAVSDCRVYVQTKTVKNYLKDKSRIYFLFLMKLLQHLVARSSGQIMPVVGLKKPLNLVDTYMIHGYENNDRWYGTLWQKLPERVKVDTFFVPTIVMTSLPRMFQTYKNLRKNRRNFVIREDFLKFSDYLFAFSYIFRLRKYHVNSVEISGYEFSDVVREDLYSNKGALFVIDSLLLYRFIKRFKEAGVKVRLAIDWFEGQIIDRAWNLAFNRFYPEAYTVGYRAFESFPFYLCSYPLPVEHEANILPQEMAVQGKATVATVQEFFPELKVIVIPSFKSQHVWQYSFDKSISESFSALIAFPISLQVSARIIRHIMGSMDAIIKYYPSIRFIIKPHPTHTFKSINNSLPELPGSFVISSERSLPKLLHKSDLLITEASSVCLEALACGIPVIIIENDAGLTFNPVPASIPESMVKCSRTKEKLIEAMISFISGRIEGQAIYRKLGKKIRADYFEPVSQNGINSFFKLENVQ